MIYGKKKDDIQSRREFFKKAANKVLPIVGAILLTSIPTIVKAEKVPMGCNYGCLGSCNNSCLHFCNSSCKFACAISCISACNGNCNHSCKNGCGGQCVGECF